MYLVVYREYFDLFSRSCISVHSFFTELLFLDQLSGDSGLLILSKVRN